MPEFRWEGLSEEPNTLFPRGRRVVGKGEYRGLTFHEVEARTIINEVPAASRMPFRWTINAYRGCSHRCSYCLEGETTILMADGRTKALADLRVGDTIIGSVGEGDDRQYIDTQVLDSWSVVKPAFRIRLVSGQELIASGEHRFLSDSGWKHVAQTDPGPRPFLSTGDKLMGPDGFLGLSSIEPLGVAIPMYDITTGTGDFVANGVISHNCFARPTHDYLGFNIGTDFDTQIVVKTNAIELLRAETSPGKWAGESISMGTNTDPYQPAEGKYRLTRGIIEVLAERKNPFSILTKSSLSLRDLDLLQEAAKEAEVSVNFSIGTLDEEVWRKTEPGTPHPRKRVEAVARFRQSGVSSGVLMAPLLPKLSDSPQQVQAVMDACREAGATFVTPITLHLRPGVKEHFMQWLAGEYPDLVGSYENLYRGRSYLQTSRRRRSIRPAPAKPNKPTQQTLPI